MRWRTVVEASMWVVAAMLFAFAMSGCCGRDGITWDAREGTLDAFARPIPQIGEEGP